MNAIMPTEAERNEVAESGLRFYRENLRAILEPAENGGAVAIHVPTGDYAIGRSHAEASRLLRERHERDGKIVSLTIGPPTLADNDIAERHRAYNKR